MALKVLVLTGKRGGFGAMKPMLRLLRDDAKFELQLVATDQHLSDRFGRTIREIEAEFTVAAAVDLEQTDDSSLARAEALGRATTKMASVIKQLNPDWIVLYGDRGEVLATAVTAATMGKPIAHIQGGDVSGSLDENIRHALTKLSHLHFPSTEESAERLRRLGEEPWRIETVGDNHIDLIVAGEFASPERVSDDLSLDLSRPVLTVLQHSETTEPEASYTQMVETMAAVTATGLQTVVVHPCSDPGYEGIIRAINDWKDKGDTRVHINLDAPIFWGLLNISTAMIGNSSAGLIETPSFRLPAINIGRRQIGRQHAENVIHVAHSRDAISNAIQTALKDAEFQKTVATCALPFGDGSAGARIVDRLSSQPITPELLVKKITY